MSNQVSRARALAPPPAELFGRQRELASARELFSATRLVTLTGPGGVGKTTLSAALSAALDRAFRDGTWFVELGAQRSSDTVAEAVVTQLGLSALATMDAEEQLCRHVADRSMLLILDNCEHVLPGCRRLLSALLAASAELRVLTTSREPLGIRGERVIGVRPLAIPPSHRDVTADELREYPAAAMLEARARAVNDQFEITEHTTAAVARLCATLDGMPLAIELAAVRLRSLSVQELLAHIDDRFALLTSGDPTAAPHHRSLDALVRWSYDLCSPTEQLLWERMAVFSGSADLPAIQAVCGLPPLEGTQLLDALDGLVCKSIVLTETAQGGMRYRFLETLREFAREQARDSEDCGRARRAHTEYYRTWATRAAENFFGPGQPEIVRRWESDITNLELAFDDLVRAAPGSHGALELAADLRFSWMSGHLRAGRRWLERALAADTTACAERGNALWAAGWFEALHGETRTARDFLDEADTIAREIGDPRMAARAATWTGLTAMIAGDFEACRSALEAAYIGHREHADAEGLLMTLFLLGLIRSMSGDHEGATAAGREAVERSERLGDTWGRSYSLWMLGFDAWTRQDLDVAEEYAKQSLTLRWDYHDNFGSAVVLYLMAGIALDNGDPKKAAKLLGVVAELLAIVDTEVPGMLGSRYQEVKSATRDRLGEDLFARHHDTGRRLDRGQRIRLALGSAATVPPDQEDAVAAADLLTPREKEVATLLAEGLSNRAIAAKLVLSPRTVEAHVEHILTKLSVNSRTEAALWAATALGGKA
ncbi:LuxR C-terminal-related transcriptional regulator [Nocardia sp. NBC_01730]|uniref:ATP-binding protein n=1 Tax=Nocardia sp. NBC_01730 TaxID=2975998 RepID=UPI002E0E41BB|nr:LuxR C-terminal-related transcriptional regulator [Nocardia sp. NBC_01730]